MRYKLKLVENTFAYSKIKISFIFIWFFLVSVIPHGSLAQEPRTIAIKKFGIKDGLITNCLDEAFIDNKGRLWLNPCLSTYESLDLGFFQFDGEKSIFYELKSNWPDKYTVNTIWILYGITDSGFLFGTNQDKSLIFYWNPDTNEQYYSKIEPSAFLYNIIPDNAGGIIALVYNNKTYRLIQLNKKGTEEIGSINIKSNNFQNTYRKLPLVINNNKIIFLNERRGLVEMNLKTKESKYTTWGKFSDIGEIKLNTFDSYGVDLQWNMIPLNDIETLLYLGQNNGFFLYDNELGTLKPYFELNSRVLSELSDNYMLKVYLSKDNKGNVLLVSGYRNSDIIAETEIKNYQAILINDNIEFFDYCSVLHEVHGTPEISLEGSNSKYFSLDFRRNIGSVSKADLILSELSANFKIKSIKSLIGMRSIMPIDSSNFFINSDFGLHNLNLSTGLFTYNTKVNSVEGLNILSPIIHFNNNLWMSLRDGGLVSYDLLTKQLDWFKMDVVFEKFIFINNQELALFTKKGELFIYNINLKTLKPHIFNGKPYSVNGGVNHLFLDESNILWVASHTGLWEINFQTEKITNYQFEDYLKTPNILCLNKRDNKTIWLGTSDSGVLIYDLSTKKVKIVNEGIGLSHNTIAGILVDDQLNRWVSTYNGISVLDQHGTILIKLNQENGLINQEFNRTSYVKMKDGRMVFGGITGIDILYPDEILKTLSHNTPLNIYLTDIEYFDANEQKSIHINQSFDQLNRIKIPALNRFLSLDFAMSEYLNLDNHSYVYRLISSEYSKVEVENIPWISLGTSSNLTLNNLQPGDYKVQIRGSDQNGKQVENFLEVPIHVKELFYRTWWYYSLCILIVSLGIIFWVRRLLTEKMRLQLEVDKRTSQIEKNKALIEEQAIELKKTNEAKTRLYTNISHEFRTPLTVILGIADQIKNDLKAKTILKRNANQLLNLVNQILELRKLESNNQKANFIQADILKYFQYLIESFHSLAENKKIKLNLEANCNALILDYDPEKILYIISNLISNAIKFTSAGGEVKVKLQAESSIIPDYYEFSVSDTGVGIYPENLLKIFDRFYQIEETSKLDGKGSGLGLSLVKELVKLLNGEIYVDSEPQKGTTFKICLPHTNQAKYEDKPITPVVLENLIPDTIAEDIKNEIKQDNKKLPNLLIVEDNSDVTDYLSFCLKDDYYLIYANDGKEGIDMAIEKVPDVVISDIMMPFVDGYELCDTLKNDFRTSHIPIILLTAKADIDSRLTGLKFGADVYLGKPFDKRELDIQVKNLLLLRKKLQDRYSNLSQLDSIDSTLLQREDEFIIKLKQIILENMMNHEFNVSFLCKKIYMSRTQLHNKLKSLTNKSTSHFIREVRIEKACQLLLNSNLNISQIAMEIGLDSQPYFSKVFREIKGVYPSDFQKKYKTEQ